MTKKNRKLRRLRELYPDVKIKLLYNRDYRSLLFKYGVEAAAQRPGGAVTETAGAAPVGLADSAEPAELERGA